MKWVKQLPNADGLWLWRLQEGGMGILSVSVKRLTAIELSVSPPICYNLHDWWDVSKDIVETYYIGEEKE